VIRATSPLQCSRFNSRNLADTWSLGICVDQGARVKTLRNSHLTEAKRGGANSLPMKRGFTPIEVLTCAAVAALVSGVAYIATEPVREKAREQTCAGHLHQIYVALLSYAADNPGPEEIPGLGQIKMVASPVTLLPYVKSHAVFYCPNTPMAKSKSPLFPWSTYELNFTITPKGKDQRVNSFLSAFKSDLASLGPKMPLVLCNMHDETYYGPREQDVDPDLAQPFQLRLQLDGNVAASRFVSKRHRSFTLQ
jgi:hypothetical protein